jgi:hypothetical protein
MSKISPEKKNYSINQEVILGKKKETEWLVILDKKF